MVTFISDKSANVRLDRGETRRLLISIKDLTSKYRLSGLSQSGLSIPYDQHLQQCRLETETTGLYLAVTADQRAITATLKVLNEDDSDQVCQTVTLQVPDRVFIANTILVPIFSTDKGLFLLEIDAPPGVDLSAVDAADISFPEGNGPSLAVLSPQDLNHIPSGVVPLDRPFECNASGIKALVRVEGAQAYPAKIVINNVKSDGALQEGVAYAALPSPEWQSSMADHDAKYIDVDGIRTRYFDKGEGEPFLLVHGGQAGSSGFSALSWIQIFDGLADHFHVYALDRIGQGYTDNPKTDKDYENYYERVVDHVYGFIKALDIDRVHLMGHSQGGWPVTRLALDHPELVRSVVIVDSSLAAPADGTKKTENFYGFVARFVHPPEGPTKESLRRDQQIFSHTLNNITDNLITRIHEISQTEKMNEARRQFGKHRMSPAHPSFRLLKETMVQDIKVGKFKVPTLIIWGLNDPEGSYHAGLKLFEFLSANSSHIQFHAFNRSGHMPCIEYPEKFNGQVVGFVTSLGA